MEQLFQLFLFGLVIIGAIGLIRMDLERIDREKESLNNRDEPK